MKTFKKVLSLILAVITVFSVCTFAFAENTKGFTDEDFLRTKGQDIVNQKGECIRTENGFQDSGHYEKNVKAYL